MNVEVAFSGSVKSVEALARFLGDFLKRTSLMAIASPQRGEVGGGN